MNTLREITHYEGGLEEIGIILHDVKNRYNFENVFNAISYNHGADHGFAELGTAAVRLMDDKIGKAFIGDSLFIWER